MQRNTACPNALSISLERRRARESLCVRTHEHRTSHKVNVSFHSGSNVFFLVLVTLPSPNSTLCESRIEISQNGSLTPSVPPAARPRAAITRTVSAPLTWLLLFFFFFRRVPPCVVEFSSSSSSPVCRGDVDVVVIDVGAAASHDPVHVRDDRGPIEYTHTFF
jgi:hypothetical protein